MPAESSSSSDAAPDRRETHATLAAGLFTNGVWDMLSIVVPLYAAAVGLSVAEIGLVVAARSVLPTVLSIHGGILMDHWGTRRVLLWLALASLALPLFYPASGWFVVLVALQMLLGLATSLGMAAGQTWSLQSSRGDTATLARFSVYSRIGSFIGPVLVGAFWDLAGAWAAFACVSIWAAGTIAATRYGAPARHDVRATPVPAGSSARALIPSWREHKQAFELVVIPVVAFVLAVSFLRNAPGAIQSSFYVVYLGELGWSGTIIGALVSVSEFFGVLGSLVAARLERRMRAAPLVVLCLVLSIVAIMVTPLVGQILVLLILAAALRGVAQGASQPLMYSLLGRAVPVQVHGATVGLRSTVTRFASIVTPAIMGFAAEWWGIEASFYIIGALYLLGTALLAVVVRDAADKYAR